MIDKPIRVLLIEDQQEDFFLTSGYLHQLNERTASTLPRMSAGVLKDASGVRYQVSWARDFSEALALGPSEYDICLLDYHLENGPSISDLKKAREDAFDLPIIFLTGKIEDSNDDSALEAGAFDFLTKDDLKPETLDRSIRYALSQYRAVQRLRSSERRFRAIFEHSREGVAFFDSTGRITFAGPNSPNIIGYQDEELQGTNVFDHLHEEDRQRAFTAVQDVASGPGSSLQGEYRVRHKDGRYLWVRATIQNLLADPAIRAIVLNVQDITEEKAAQLSAEENERRFRAMIENGNDVISLSDSSTTLFYISPGCERILGWQAAELVGTRGLDLIIEEDHPTALQVVTEILQSPGESRLCQLRFRRKDGAVRTMEASLTNLLTDPSVHAIVSNFRDITERLEAERARLESEEIFARTFWNSPLSIGITRAADSVAVNANSGFETLTGYTREEVLNRSAEELHLWAKPEERDAIFQRLPETGFIQDVEISIRRKDGSIRKALASFTYIELNGEKCTLTLATDITDRTEAVAELARSRSNLSALIENTGDSIFSIDSQHRLITYNTSFRERMLTLFGLDLESGMDLLPYLEAHEGRWWKEAVTRGLSGQGFLEERCYGIAEGRLLSCPGSDLQTGVQRLVIEASFNPIRDNGTVTGVSIFLKDITEKRRTIEQLRFQARALAEVNEAIVAIDTNWKITYWNAGAERLYRYSAEAVLGKELRSVLHYTYNDPDDEPLAIEAMDRDRRWSGRFDHQLPDGSWITVFSSVNYITDETGKVTGMLSLSRDITAYLQTEQRLRFQANALGQASDAIVAIDNTGVITYWNNAAAHLFAIPASKAVGSHAFEIYNTRWINPNDEQEAYRAMDEHGAWTGEHIFVRPDGSERILSSSITLLHDEKGQAIGRLASTRDITEKRATEEALRRSELSYRTLFEDSPLPMWIIDPDSLMIIRVNTAACKHYGYAKEEFEQMTLLDIRPVEDHEAFLNIQPSLQHSPNDRFGVWRHLRKDGSIIYVDAISHPTWFNGRPLRLTLINDITRRREMEQALIQANERFRLAAEAVTAVIYDWDLITGGTERTGGLKALLGYERSEDAFSQNFNWWLSLVNEQDRQSLVDVVFDALREGSTFDVEYRIRHKNGHFVYVWDRGVVVRDENGKAIRVVGSTQDITDRKRMEAQLAQERMLALLAKDKAEEMSKLKTSFLTNMSHEIRTPMTAILGFASILSESTPNTELKQYAAMIESSGRRLLDTINGVLDLAKVESNRLELHPVPTQVVAEVTKSVMLLQPLATKRGVTLHQQSSVGRIEAVIDPHYLSQILVNLIGNAIKFTDEGEVEVSVLTERDSTLIQFPSDYSVHRTAPTPAQPHFTLVIRDTGIGVSPSFLRSMFDEFKQESTGYERRYEGSGLGLSITRRLVEAMHGSIEVASAVGRGTTFVVRLPLAAH